MPLEFAATLNRRRVSVRVELGEVLHDIADAIVRIDTSGKPFRAFQPGVGPYGEPQLVKLIAADLNQIPKYRNSVRTKRNPDLLIPNEWAIEFKITRPFGDNDKEAEDWSVNLLHPYPGNVSTIGDCYWQITPVRRDARLLSLVTSIPRPNRPDTARYGI